MNGTSRAMLKGMEKTITLGRQTYTVAAESAMGWELTGKRGGRFTLVRNQKNPILCCLISYSNKTSWWIEQADGSFTRAHGVV